MQSTMNGPHLYTVKRFNLCLQIDWCYNLSPVLLLQCFGFGESKAMSGVRQANMAIGGQQERHHWLIRQEEISSALHFLYECSHVIPPFSLDTFMDVLWLFFEDLYGVFTFILFESCPLESQSFLRNILAAIFQSDAIYTKRVRVWKEEKRFCILKKSCRECSKFCLYRIRNGFQ